MVGHLWIVRVQVVLQSELLIGSLVQAEALVEPNDGFLAEGGHDELQERQRLPLEQVRLLHADRLVLPVLHDAVECIIKRQVLLLQDGDL